MQVTFGYRYFAIATSCQGVARLVVKQFFDKSLYIIREPRSIFSCSLGLNHQTSLVFFNFRVDVVGAKSILSQYIYVQKNLLVHCLSIVKEYYLLIVFNYIEEQQRKYVFSFPNRDFLRALP